MGAPPWELPLLKPPDWLGGASSRPGREDEGPAGETGPAGPPMSSPEGFGYREGASTDTNAQRTSGRAGIGPYAEAGTTSSGDSVYAGAAVLKGRDPVSGGEVEVLTVSGQVGLQNEVQAGMMRVGVSSDDGRQSATVEVLTARANIGIHNPDGSTGFNAGAMAVGGGVEGTANYSGNSITGGLSLSAGAEGYVGVRDSDGDGSKELSVRVSVMFFTVGFAIENPF